MSGADRLQLEPVLTSVAEARALVGEVAGRHGFDDAVTADAAIIVSELVTNAVLHARTAVDLAIALDGALVRIEVTDASEMPVFAPEPDRFPESIVDLFDDPVSPDLDAIIEALATTGRGMELVASLAAAWGVTAHAEGGKTVWAEIPLVPPGPPTAPIPATAGSAGPRRAPEPLPPEAKGPAVRLVAVPLRLIIDSDRSFDDTIRELQVIALAGGADPEIAALANTAMRLFAVLGPVRFKSQDEVWAARERGDRLVDLHLTMPPDVLDRLAELDALLGAITSARTDGRLLVVPPPQEVVAFRIWYGEEVRRQMEGDHLRPCPFPAVRPPAGPQVVEGDLSQRRRRLLDGLRRELEAASDARSVTQSAARRVAADTGASFVNLLLVEPDGQHVSLAHRIGYDPDEQHGRRYPLSHDNPISEVVRIAEPIVLRTHDERVDRYPRLIPSAPLEANPTGVWVPLGDRPPAAGVLVVGFGRARDFTGKDLRYLMDVGRAILARLEAVGRFPGSR